MKKSIIILSIVFILVSLPAYAGFYNGNQLILLMREVEKATREEPKVDFSKVYEFGGYVLGVYDFLDRIGTVCTANTVEKGQIMAVVTKYLNDNPARWNEPAVVLVSEALRRAFPCKK